MGLLYDVHSHNTKSPESVYRIQQLSIGDVIPESPFSVSIHPWDVDENIEIDQLKPYLLSPYCIAVGETGLDKLKGNLELQKDVFLKHIHLAKQFKKPLILHCVRAFEECMALLSEQSFTNGVLFHGFNKHPNLAHQIIKKGYYIGLGASFLKENSNFEHFLVEYNFKGVLFETDMALELDIKELYHKAQRIHPTLDIEKIITETFNNWREK